MLVQFSCSNFKSIKDNVIFSMRSIENKPTHDRTAFFNDILFERIAVIYGANGSGKSNFIDAVSFSKYIVENSLSFQPGQFINVPVHKLADVDDESSFTFQFIFDDTRYFYSFSLLHGLVSSEYLYFFPHKRKIKIFERKNLSVSLGSKYKQSDFNVSLETLQNNRLFLSCAANYSRIQEIKNAFLFFIQKLVIYKVNIDSPRTNNWLEYSIDIMQKKANIRQNFLSILKTLDTGIVDIKTEIKHFNPDEDMPHSLTKIIKTALPAEALQNGINIPNASIFYPNFSVDLINEESTGIKKLFQFICPMLDIIDDGKVLLCDEFETGLHEAVVHKIIELFYSIQPQKHSQLIFTTHNTCLLDNALFNKGQIWFTQLNDERSTDLFSLAEIKNIRKGENIAKGYIQGKYGAIPMLNKTVGTYFDYEAVCSCAKQK